VEYHAGVPGAPGAPGREAANIESGV